MGWYLPIHSITSITWGEFDFTSLWCGSRYDNVPTPWRRILIKKLTVFQLGKKLPAVCDSKMFITVFQRAWHWSQTWARWQCSKLLINLQISDLHYTSIIQKINLNEYHLAQNRFWYTHYAWSLFNYSPFYVI